MHVTVMGTGFVGLVVGACLADFGLSVTCADVDQAKIKQLQGGKIPIYELGLPEIIQRNVAGKRLSFSSDIRKSIEDSLVLFVCVGTEPRPDGRVDYRHVRKVARAIGRYMEDYKVVVIKSTVPVGTSKLVYEWIRRAQKQPIDLDIVSNPEFLREGAAVEDFMRPNRVILGGENPRALAIVKDIYRPLYLIEVPFVVTDNRTAELIKYATNSFLAIKISYINEIARLCDRVGSDVHVVAKALGLDGRIGRKFLHPGPGFGGSCLPKDTRAFLKVFEDFGLKNQLVAASLAVNRSQPHELIQKLRKGLGNLRDRKICLLGLSYKPNTNDIRESPALDLAKILLQAGARLRAFDPVALGPAAVALRHSHLSMHSNPYEAAREAEAVIVATEWNEFRNLDLARLKKSMRGDVLLDCRNIYDPVSASNLGFRYYGVGRSAPLARPDPGPQQRSRLRRNQ
jgi:UDPglucose 6-dehydrogenase